MLADNRTPLALYVNFSGEPHYRTVHMSFRNTRYACSISTEGVFLLQPTKIGGGKFGMNRAVRTDSKLWRQLRACAWEAIGLESRKRGWS